MSRICCPCCGAGARRRHIVETLALYVGEAVWVERHTVVVSPAVSRRLFKGAAPLCDTTVSFPFSHGSLALPRASVSDESSGYIHSKASFCQVQSIYTLVVSITAVFITSAPNHLTPGPCMVTWRVAYVGVWRSASVELLTGRRSQV